MSKKEQKKIQENKENEIFMLILVTILVGAVYLGWIKMPDTKKISKVLPEVGLSNFANGHWQDSLSGNIKSPAENFKIGEEVIFEEYAQNRGWKGIVIAERNENYTIEIKEIITHATLDFDLFPRPCSGNRILNKNSVGMKIVVPKGCWLKKVENRR